MQGRIGLEQAPEHGVGCGLGRVFQAHARWLVDGRGRWLPRLRRNGTEVERLVADLLLDGFGQPFDSEVQRVAGQGGGARYAAGRQCW
ncbi:hypothetical protein D9598_19175 [Roseomonas sp. KE0001]|nr:hypothetical protein [Roseomonas sp. KE0001]